jgi:hypothetical protein
MKEQSNSLTTYNVAAWEKFVAEVLESLDEIEPLSAKDICKIMISNKWGNPTINLINKALSYDLKNKVSKTSKAKWTKLKSI